MGGRRAAGRGTWVAAVALAVLAVPAVAGCGSGDGGDGGDGGRAEGADLAGSWVADAGALLDRTMARLGVPGDVTCTGPITTDFAADGTFVRSGDVTCSAGPLTATGRIDTTGSWSADGTQLTISGSTRSGTIEVNGTAVPTPDAFGDGVADYRLTGDTLEVTFEVPTVGTVTQAYTRAG